MRWFESNFTSIEENDFEAQALSLFRFQIETNKVYRNYAEQLLVDPNEVKSIQQIPFLPIQFFKNFEVKSTNFPTEIIFTSSGTTGTKSSQHFVKDLTIYESSFLSCFEKYYGAVEDHCVLALLPAYLERKGSSLVYMADKLIQKSKSADSGFFLNEHSKLEEILNRRAEGKQNTLLLGVSFGLLDFIEKSNIKPNPNLIVMETGGMKGRRKEMIREELHEQLRSAYHLNEIHSEYGMTELLSQAYSNGNGKFTSPPWMKVLCRRQDNPFEFCKPTETGALNIIDLANIYSCAFIQTDDLGKVYKNGSFEVLGRFDQADVRGCNLLIA